MGQSKFDKVKAGSVEADSVALGTQSANIADLTDSSGGTPDGTINAISGSGDDAAINKNFAEVAAKLAALNAALEANGITASS